jgi:hypothetical protein
MPHWLRVYLVVLKNHGNFPINTANPAKIYLSHLKKTISNRLAEC